MAEKTRNHQPLSFHGGIKFEGSLATLIEVRRTMIVTAGMGQKEKRNVGIDHPRVPCTRTVFSGTLQLSYSSWYYTLVKRYDKNAFERRVNQYIIHGSDDDDDTLEKNVSSTDHGHLRLPTSFHDTSNLLDPSMVWKIAGNMLQVSWKNCWKTQTTMIWREHDFSSDTWYIRHDNDTVHDDTQWTLMIRDSATGDRKCKEWG